VNGDTVTRGQRCTTGRRAGIRIGRARRSDARFVVVRVVARFGSVRFVVVVVVVIGGGGGGAGR